MTELFALRSPHAAADPGPTVVLLHGYGSDERDLPALAQYLPGDLPWVSLRAPLRHPSFGYAWYQLEDGFSPHGQIADATAAVWDWVDENLPASARIVPMGFSQGGLMASQLLRTRPARIGATVILSGYVADGAQAADAQVAQSRPPVFFGRGDADQVIPAPAVTAAAAWLETNSAVDARVYAGMGHTVSDAEMRDVQRFLAGALVGDGAL